MLCLHGSHQLKIGLHEAPLHAGLFFEGTADQPGVGPDELYAVTLLDAPATHRRDAPSTRMGRRNHRWINFLRVQMLIATLPTCAQIGGGQLPSFPAVADRVSGPNPTLPPGWGPHPPQVLAINLSIRAW
jgi:hypothetical protein